jgi:dipeptidase E
MVLEKSTKSVVGNNNMKIILASKEKFLLDKAYDLLGIPRDKLKIGFINTALKVVENNVYIEYMEEYYALMSSSGIDFKQFDIEGKTEKEIFDFFADRNVVQVSGGNLFYLLKAVKETRFDLILKKFLENNLCYVGCSAGAYIMCPTIEVGGWKLDRNRHGLVDLTALSCVPFLIKCHFNDNQKEEIVERAKTLKYSLRVLKDDQCFYVENGEVLFTGNSEEVLF